MKKLIIPLFFALVSCGSQVEEIKNSDTGQLELRYEYYLDDDGQKIKHGELIEWYYDGSKRLTQNYEDGVLQGQSIFYKNKDTIAYNNYLNGELSGECLLQDDQGIIFSKFNYKDGLLYGQQEYFYPDGTKKSIGTYDFGIPDGKWTYFNKKNKKTGTLNVDLGTSEELTGVWKVKGKNEVYYAFKEDGSFTFSAPLFKYSTRATEIMSGQTLIGPKLQLVFNSGREYKSFDVQEVHSNKLVLINEESSEAILWIRQKDTVKVFK